MAPALLLFVGAACRPGFDERTLLAREGLRCLWLADAAQAQQAAHLARFDAVIVDAGCVAAPFALTLARLRLGLDCPLLLVAAEGADEDVDEILALELGIEVYLRRPLPPRRLCAHLLALLRRPVPVTVPAAAAEAPWRLDREAHRLSAEGQSIDLTGTQTALLHCLLAARGCTVTREQLRAALPLGAAMDGRTVDVYMHRLRRRLAEAGLQTLHIEAVRGRGYLLTAARFEAPLSLLAALSAA